MKKFKQKSIPQMALEDITPSRMAVSRGFFCVCEQDKMQVPALVCSWWADGWLISIVFHSLQ